MTECDEIIIVMSNVSTRKVNVASTTSINCHGKENKRLLYFANSFISGHITIDNYYYLLSLSKIKKYNIK